MHLPSTHGLKPDFQYLPEVPIQSFTVITPTKISASNIGLIVAYICQQHLAKFSDWFNWTSFCQDQHQPICQSHRF